MKKPRTLQQAIIYFSNPDNCIELVAAMRWPKGVTCPTCGRKDAKFLANQKKWQCKSVHHHRQFSVKVGTIFEDSALPLDKWLVAIWMVSNCKNGISSYELARALGITQKSAWFMLHRIRLAMQNRSISKLGGFGRPVEADETFIGGAARNMHKEKYERRIRKYGSKYGTKDKTPVMGILQRNAEGKSEVRAFPVPNVRKHHLQEEIRKHIAAGSALYTDKLQSYSGLSMKYDHKTVDHMEQYVDGQVHTNGLENFWSLLKRGLKGTYVSVEAFHLFRYLDEQVCRFNFRDLPHDGFRFEHVLRRIFGKRLTYSEVTGKVCPTPA